MQPLVTVLLTSRARVDMVFRDQLTESLSRDMLRWGSQVVWHDLERMAQGLRTTEIEQAIEQADIYVLLISDHMLGAPMLLRWCERMVERVRVLMPLIVLVPLLVSPCSWDASPLVYAHNTDYTPIAPIVLSGKGQQKVLSAAKEVRARIEGALHTSI